MAEQTTTQRMTTDEVAQAMGVTVRTVRRWVAAGCPRQWQTRRYYTLDLAEVREWLQNPQNSEGLKKASGTLVQK